FSAIEQLNYIYFRNQFYAKLFFYGAFDLCGQLKDLIGRGSAIVDNDQRLLPVSSGTSLPFPLPTGLFNQPAGRDFRFPCTHGVTGYMWKLLHQSVILCSPDNGIFIYPACIWNFHRVRQLAISYINNNITNILDSRIRNSALVKLF